MMSITSSHEIQVRKKQWRSAMRQERRSLSESARAQAAAAVTGRLIALLDALRREREISPLALFLANDEEINVDGVAAWLWQRQGVVVAPRFNPSQQDAPFYPLQSTFAVETGVWGVREPVAFAGGSGYRPAQIQVALVPGLAFDRSGGRLGYGGGWYDKLLAAVPLRIGVCFDFQIVPSVPHEAHDVLMHMIVCPSDTIDVTPHMK